MNISVILFAIIAIIGTSFFSYNIWKIKYNINLGLPTERSGQRGKRLKTMLLVAFGQKKMFKRWIPATFHFFIYFAFNDLELRKMNIPTTDLIMAKRNLYLHKY